MKTLKHISLVGALAFGMTAMPTQAMAQSYPDKPIRLIVADAPGGAPDILARMLAQKMSDSMGQPVVVDNKPGAAGMLGAEQCCLKQRVPLGQLSRAVTRECGRSLIASLPP